MEGLTPGLWLTPVGGELTHLVGGGGGHRCGVWVPPVTNSLQHPVPSRRAGHRPHGYWSSSPGGPPAAHTTAAPRAASTRTKPRFIKCCLGEFQKKSTRHFINVPVLKLSPVKGKHSKCL